MVNLNGKDKSRLVFYCLTCSDLEENMHAQGYWNKITPSWNWDLVWFWSQVLNKYVEWLEWRYDNYKCVTIFASTLNEDFSNLWLMSSTIVKFLMLSFVIVVIVLPNSLNVVIKLWITWPPHHSLAGKRLNVQFSFIDLLVQNQDCYTSHHILLG